MSKLKRRRKAKKVFFLTSTFIISLLLSGYCIVLLLLKGPSPTLSNLLISTMMETRRGKAIVHMLFSNEEVDLIMKRNTLNKTEQVTNNNNEPFVISPDKKNLIEVVDIQGATFKGKLMIVHDPSRISLGVNTLMATDKQSGFLVEDFIASEHAIGGINAGGFDDPGGKGDGSIPYGIVIKDGKLVNGKPSDYNNVIGFNTANRLIVGNMTAEQALSYDLKNAVTFGPVLIVNYEPVVITGAGGGLNPRTLIGQREDGAVLLMTIDGRQTTSLGASYSDCIELMLKYGAMNAANLDGGSSTVMVYEGKIINSVVSMNGDRRVPTAWIVK